MPLMVCARHLPAIINQICRLSSFVVYLQLYNIVVDDDKTAQQLLDKGQLRRKYTILPLNKLTARPVDKRVVDHARNLVSQ